MNKYASHILVCVSILFSSMFSYAQISAQGQGGKDVVWLAIGAEQRLGKRWTNKNTIAYSRHSSLSTWNALQQSGIFTVREELVFRLSTHWKISQGVFYAERNYYDPEHPIYLNEVRIYPRIVHEFSFQNVLFSHYLRTDIRFFSSPGFAAYNKPMQVRNRYLLKATLPLDPKGINAIVGMTEIFFATDKEIAADGSRQFTAYGFAENRTSLYFRHKIEKPNAFLDIGIMVQTWKDKHIQAFRETFILQGDLIFVNPFGK